MTVVCPGCIQGCLADDVTIRRILLAQKIGGHDACMNVWPYVPLSDSVRERLPDIYLSNE
jgi:hypothetical protein